MKKLFAVLLAVAMLLSLGVTAFADDVGDILIPNSSTATEHVRSRAYKIFDVKQTANADGTTTLTYSLPATVEWDVDGNGVATVVNPWVAALTEADGTPPMVKAKGDAKGLEFIPVLDDPTKAYDADNNPVVKYNINKTTEFSAEKFASMLQGLVKADADAYYPYKDDSGIVNNEGYLKDDVTIDVPSQGYYLIVSSGETDDGAGGKVFDTTKDSFKAPAALTTVLADDVKVEPKHDIPLDKTVDTDGDGEYKDDGEGVKLGDTLNYKVESKIPFAGADPTAYIYRVWDTMHEGLTFGNTLTIEVGDQTSAGHNYIKYEITYLPADPNTVPPRFDESITVMKTAWDETQAKYVTAASTDFTLVKDDNADLTGNQVRFGVDGKAFELSLDVGSNDATSFKPYHDETVTISYSATVNEKAVADVLDNRVVLAYGNDANNLNVKDDSTKNYDSKIQIDKFAEGNNSQKLKGAEFVLFRNNPQEDKNGVKRDAYGDIIYDREYYALIAKGLTAEGIAYIGEANPTAGFKYGENLKYYHAGSDYVAATGAGADDDYYVIANPTFDADGNLVIPAELKDSNGHPYFESIEVMWVKDLQKWDATASDFVDTTDPGEADNITRVVTDIDGFAQFGYLPDSGEANNTWKDTYDNNGTPAEFDRVDTDGKYYLQETKAPIDYAKLLNPIPVVVDGSASTDPSMTKPEQDMILTNVVNVPNTPGSTLPSTGGVGATMMTIGGIALILAAGAFLVLRRRKEQE